MQTTPQKPRRLLHQSIPAIIFVLFLFFPFGAFLLWKNEELGKKSKITLVVIVLVAFYFFQTKGKPFLIDIMREQTADKTQTVLESFLSTVPIQKGMFEGIRYDDKKNIETCLSIMRSPVNAIKDAESSNNEGNKRLAALLRGKLVRLQLHAYPKIRLGYARLAAQNFKSSATVGTIGIGGAKNEILYITHKDLVDAEVAGILHKRMYLDFASYNFKEIHYRQDSTQKENFIFRLHTPADTALFDFSRFEQDVKANTH